MWISGSLLQEFQNLRVSTAFELHEAAVHDCYLTPSSQFYYHGSDFTLPYFNFQYQFQVFYFSQCT